MRSVGPDRVATIRIFLVDEFEIVRRGVADVLAAQPGFRVVGEARSVAEAAARIAEVRPDVVLLDARLPDGDGLDVCREVARTSPNTRCIVLTAEEDEAVILGAVMAGAAGFLLKRVHGAQIVDAVRKVAAGGSFLDPVVAGWLLARLRTSGSVSPLETLTGRERQVLALVADGLSNAQIASRLDLSPKTVKNHVTGVLQKLGLRSRVQVASFVADRGVGSAST